MDMVRAGRSASTHAEGRVGRSSGDREPLAEGISYGVAVGGGAGRLAGTSLLSLHRALRPMTQQVMICAASGEACKVVPPAVPSLGEPCGEASPSHCGEPAERAV